jgi:hypothetical protein
MEHRLVGVALAGWLLEYGAIYCLHTPRSSSDASALLGYFGYTVAPLHEDALLDPALEDLDGEGAWLDGEAAAATTNSLESQPLILFRVLLSAHDRQGSHLEVMAFSVPRLAVQDPSHSNGLETDSASGGSAMRMAKAFRSTVQQLFRVRLDRLPQPQRAGETGLLDLLRTSRITVEISQVTLDRIAL